VADYGGGAILGGLLALGRRPRRPLVVAELATLGFPLPPLALALHLPAAAVAAGALVAGLGSAFGGALDATVTQQRVPQQALSRVGSFNLVGAFAFGPVAFAAAGPVAAAVGARAVLGFGAAWAAFGTLAVFAVPAVRRMTWLPADPPRSGSGLAGSRLGGRGRAGRAVRRGREGKFTAVAGGSARAPGRGRRCRWRPGPGPGHVPRTRCQPGCSRSR
jgi:hypothetical protein